MSALPAFYAFQRISNDGRRKARRIQIWPTHFLMRKMRPKALKKALINFGKVTKNQLNSVLDGRERQLEATGIMGEADQVFA